MKKLLASLAALCMMGCPPATDETPAPVAPAAPIDYRKIEDDMAEKRIELRRREQEFFNSWGKHNPPPVASVGEGKSFPFIWEDIGFKGGMSAQRTRIPEGWLVLFEGYQSSCAVIVSDTAGVWHKDLQED
jgi:hypothetical protein